MIFGLLLLLIIGGGYFAASETAFASVNAIKIKKRAENGERRALRAQHVLENFNQALSTLLIGNNLMHIGAAALSTYLVTKLWGEGYTAYSTLATTVVVFLVSEMIPKQFAKDKPEVCALFFAPSLCFLMRILAPICAIFDSISAFLTKLMKAEPAPTVTEAELDYLIDTLGKNEKDGNRRSNLLRSALHFDDRTARDVMIPITNVMAIDVTCSRKKILQVIRSNKFSRLPVCRNSLDQIVGILDTRQYMRAYLAENKDCSVKKLMRKPKFVSADRRIDDLLDELAQSRTHMCVVTDEKNCAVGVLTMEDILEELVGEIMDEDDTLLPEMGGAAV